MVKTRACIAEPLWRHRLSLHRDACCIAVHSLGLISSLCDRHRFEGGLLVIEKSCDAKDAPSLVPT